MSDERGAASARLETKFLPFEGAAAVGEDGRIEGYASLFDTPDDGGDEVAPGAFAASLARRGASVKLLWQHDATQPIGVWDTIVEDARGLKVAGRLLAEVRRGAEAAALLRAGAVDGLSIGYRATKATRRAGGGRRLTEIELWEISLVTFPMLSGARAHSAGEPGDDEAGSGDAAALAEALRAARTLFT